MCSRLEKSFHRRFNTFLYLKYCNCFAINGAGNIRVHLIDNHPPFDIDRNDFSHKSSHSTLYCE